MTSHKSSAVAGTPRSGALDTNIYINIYKYNIYIYLLHIYVCDYSYTTYMHIQIYIFYSITTLLVRYIYEWSYIHMTNTCM